MELKQRRTRRGLSAGLFSLRSVKKLIFDRKAWIIGGAVIIIVAIIAFAPQLSNLSNPQNIGIYNLESNLTNEEKEITQETVNEYANLQLEGYQQVKEGNRSFDAVVIKVTNKGQDTTCIAVKLVAEDQEGSIIDRSSLYAEEIHPGETQTFNTFAYSDLAPGRLQNAKFEIYKAYTYDCTARSNDENETVPDDTHNNKGGDAKEKGLTTKG